MFGGNSDRSSSVSSIDSATTQIAQTITQHNNDDDPVSK